MRRNDKKPNRRCHVSFASRFRRRGGSHPLSLLLPPRAIDAAGQSRRFQRSIYLAHRQPRSNAVPACLAATRNLASTPLPSSSDVPGSSEGAVLCPRDFRNPGWPLGSRACWTLMGANRLAAGTRGLSSTTFCRAPRSRLHSPGTTARGLAKPVEHDCHFPRRATSIGVCQGMAASPAFRLASFRCRREQRGVAINNPTRLAAG